MFFFGNGGAFLPNCSWMTLSSEVEADAHHAERGAHGEGVLRDFVLADIGQCRHRQRAQLDALGMLTGLDGVSVVNAGAAGGEEAQVASIVS